MYDQYETLLRHVLEHGRPKSDRTKTGTLSVFGAQLRFDLRAGFPLITTKRVGFRWVAEELFWFLSGSTDERVLRAKGVDIWKEWATAEQCAKFDRAEGDLGPVYGWQWRSFGAPYPMAVEQPTPALRAGLERGYLGIGNSAGRTGHPLGPRWVGMMARCYDPASTSFPFYGARGVHVCDRWLEFAAFAEDAVQLSGWNAARLDELELDKDGVGTGYRYGPEDCQWITRSENAALRDRRVFYLEKDGRQHVVRNIDQFCREQGIDGRNISDLWTGRKNAKTRHGFRLVRVVDPEGGVDQLARLVRDIKSSPESRRLIVTAWHPRDADAVTLPPCHMFFQCYVSQGELSLHMYQRSADMFLGVPFNIASYALLTHLLAHACGLAVGEYVHSFGDAHIYSNHVAQVREQLARAPRPYPRLEVDPAAPRELDGLRFEHLRLTGYDPHPKIEAPVAV